MWPLEQIFDDFEVAISDANLVGKRFTVRRFPQAAI